MKAAEPARLSIEVNRLRREREKLHEAEGVISRVRVARDTHLDHKDRMQEALVSMLGHHVSELKELHERKDDLVAQTEGMKAKAVAKADSLAERRRTMTTYLEAQKGNVERHQEASAALKEKLTAELAGGKPGGGASGGGGGGGLVTLAAVAGAVALTMLVMRGKN